MENLHNSVMINEIISFLPLKKSINVIDATFGGGGYSKTILKKFEIPLIGSHNVKNATAAIAVSYFIGVSPIILKSALKNFKGVERRFNKIFTYNGAEIYDDYAHILQRLEKF